MVSYMGRMPVAAYIGTDLFFHLGIEHKAGQIAEHQRGRRSYSSGLETAHEKPHKAFRVHGFFYSFHEDVSEAQKGNGSPGPGKVNQRLVPY